MVGQPIRTCVGCRRAAPASQLVRLALARDGSLRLDRSAAGRGAWLCAGQVAGIPAVSCLDAAARRRAFDRAFRTVIDAGQVAMLRETVRERARIESGGAIPLAAHRRD